MLTPVSSIPGVDWPAVPQVGTAKLLSVLFQLEQSQWCSTDELAARQQAQLKRVIRHAADTVPFYRQRLDQAGFDPDRAVTPDRCRQLPLLGRRDVQFAGTALHSTAIPPQHGRVSSITTSGSTGAAVTTLTTDVTRFVWRVLTLRDHVWHRRDLAQSFAAIRYVKSGVARYPAGQRAENWGPATEGLATGPAYLLSIDSSVEEQAEWLSRINPHYLLGYPSALEALAQRFANTPGVLSKLREVRSFGEILESTCRDACQTAWKVNVVDMYSAQETGYIALQCPAGEHYHVQAESALVEVIDDEGRPCQPGEIGRVVVTTLHNFAMPLLRYEIGDFAEVGAGCPCGRNLPVLRRILGRQRNLLTLPSGQRRWPSLGDGERLKELPPIQQFQIIQSTVHQVEVRIVSPVSFSSDQQLAVKQYVQEALGFPFEVSLRFVADIPRSPSGKFEDFISHVGREVPIAQPERQPV